MVRKYIAWLNSEALIFGGKQASEFQITPSECKLIVVL